MRCARTAAGQFLKHFVNTLAQTAWRKNPRTKATKKAIKERVGNYMGVMGMLTLLYY